MSDKWTKQLDIASKRFYQNKFSQYIEKMDYADNAVFCERTHCLLVLKLHRTVQVIWSECGVHVRQVLYDGLIEKMCVWTALKRCCAGNLYFSTLNMSTYFTNLQFWSSTLDYRQPAASTLLRVYICAYCCLRLCVCVCVFCFCACLESRKSFYSPGLGKGGIRDQRLLSIVWDACRCLSISQHTHDDNSNRNNTL